MTRINATIFLPSFLLGGILLMTLAPAPVQAQTFDTSGTVNLSGKYLFRYVDFLNDGDGNLTESCSLSGTITFDGAGSYTLSSTRLSDSAGSNGAGSCSSLGSGTYGVQSNGIAQLDNPLYPATLFGTFSRPVVIASSTEDGFFDLFIAVQAPDASSANGLLSGDYTVGTLDFPNASAALARQGYFTVKADGQGNIAGFTLTGSAENVQSGNTVMQSVSASTYTLNGAAGGTVTFPGSSDSQTQIVSGAKLLYVSADGNWFVGGSPTGSDMFFGFHAPSGGSSNSLLSGTYFLAGMEDELPTAVNFLDAFYGSVNNSGGTLIWHERFDDVVDGDTFDNTFASTINIGAGGSYYDGLYTYLAGADGKALMLIGSNQQFSLVVGINAPSFTSSPVWINPIGITNAANYTPITNAYAPGELVNLYGNFGVSTQANQSLPVPVTLGGVQVLVNARAAPISLVSKNQISALIPYEVSGEYFATFQVVVNGTKSNQVTVYVDNTAPGIYTLTEDGIGAGAVLHSDYSEVSDKNPAKPGETLLLFMNGLGSVTPQVADGVAAPIRPVSVSDEEEDGVFVFLEDGAGNQAYPNVTFAGLAPGFAGLYQVNFTLPTTGLDNGVVAIVFETIEALNQMSSITLSGFPKTNGQIVPRRCPSRLGRRNVSASKLPRGGAMPHFRPRLLPPPVAGVH